MHTEKEGQGGMITKEERKTADFTELKGWQGYTPPHMVQIPLEEYRRYIESNIKGPTVEIAIEEYDRLRFTAEEIKRDMEMLRQENIELRAEIERRESITGVIKRETEKVIAEIKRNVTDSDTVADRTTERIYRKRTEIKEEADNGRI